MIDISDLICTAQRLQAKGWKRRAGEVWRRVAIHPDTPEDLRGRLWICADNGREIDGSGRERASLAPEAKAARAAQIAELWRAGMSKQRIAAAVGVSDMTVARVLKAQQQAAH